MRAFPCGGALGVAVLAAAIFAVGCGDEAIPRVSDDNPSQPPFLQTPRGERQLPPGVFAIAWEGQGETQLIVEEPLPAGYRVETVASGLDNPVDMAFLPDGRILVTEQYSGLIRIIDQGLVLGEPFAEIENVVQDQLEQGLLGIAIDPDFEQNRWVYVFYVEAAADAPDFPSRSVLLRLTESEGIASDPQELAELPFGAAGQHNGGGVRFGPDGKLYVTLGDTNRADLASDPSETVGKILRLEPNGEPAAGNPFLDTPNADPRVYATGFRNVFGIAFHPSLPDGLLALDNAEFEGDEIDIVRPGLHYGWPDGDGQPPIWSYLNNVGPAGAVVYTGSELAAFEGDLFFCQFHFGGVLHRVQLSAGLDRVLSDSIAARGCTSSVAQGSDGLLYFLDRVSGDLNRIGLAD